MMIKVPVSLEFFPPKTPEGIDQAGRGARRAVCAQARVLLGHLRRGRLDADGHAAGGAGDPRRRRRRRAALHLHRRHARERGRDAGRLQGRRRSAPGRAARRPAQRLRQLRRVPLRHRADRADPQALRRPLPHRGGRLSRDASAGALARGRPEGVRRQGGRRRRTRRSRRCSSTPTRTSASSTRCARMGIARAHRAGHHADHQLERPDALRRQHRLRDPALDAPAPAVVRRRREVHQGLRPGRDGGAVRPPHRRRRAVAALLHDEPGGADAGAGGRPSSASRITERGSARWRAKRPPARQLRSCRPSASTRTFSPTAGDVDSRTVRRLPSSMRTFTS